MGTCVVPVQHPCLIQTEFKKYNNVVVVVDEDAAGLKAVIEARAFFLYKIPFVSYLKLSPDANEILNEKGPEALREVLQRANTR